LYEVSTRRQRRKGAKERRHRSRSGAPPSARGARLADRVERLAYTRNQAAEALGVSLATLDRRVVPTIATVRTEWGARLIPVAELERYLAERRESARAERRQRARSGRRSGLPAEVIARIRSEHARGDTLGQIARRLNADGTPTSQGGRQWWPSTVRAVLVR
jgi:Recombinase